MFRGKESSNRIELSRLVQDLLNFGVSAPCSSGEGAGGWGASGGMGGVPPTHMHMHAHVRTHTHAHLYMYGNCKWLPTWRHPCLACLACLTCMCVHACACICACMGHPLHIHAHPHPHPPICHPPRGVDLRNHSKFDNTSTYQDISILFEDLKSVKNSPPMGGCVVWWVGGWLGGLMGRVRSNH